MAPSFLSWAKALSTSLWSSPERVATSPADTGLPALRIVSRTFVVVSMIDSENYPIKSINASACDFRRTVCSSFIIIRPAVQHTLRLLGKLEVEGSLAVHKTVVFYTIVKTIVVNPE